MISPINSDKTVNASTEQSGRSNPSQKTTAASEQATARQSQAAEPNSATLEVDLARRLFDIENNRMQRSETNLETPQQARSLLESVVQQITASPQAAAKAQAGKASSQLSGILQSAPA